MDKKTKFLSIRLTEAQNAWLEWVIENTIAESKGQAIRYTIDQEMAKSDAFLSDVGLSGASKNTQAEGAAAA